MEFKVEEIKINNENEVIIDEIANGYVGEVTKENDPSGYVEINITGETANKLFVDSNQVIQLEEFNWEVKKKAKELIQLIEEKLNQKQDKF